MARYGRYMSLGKRIAVVVLSVVIGAAIVLTSVYWTDIKAFFGVMGNYTDRIKEEMEEEKNKQEENTDGETDTNTGFESGNDFITVESAGVALAYTSIAEEDYAAYGVAEAAESAMTLTASVSPSNATNVNLDWSVSFVDPSSEWATGKTVTDYVTITEQTETTAVLTNLLPFGEQIQIKVCVADNTAVNAVAFCDYVQRITGFTSEIIGNSIVGIGGNVLYNRYVDLEYMKPVVDSTNITNIYSDYTVTDIFSYSYEICVNETYNNALKTLESKLKLFAPLYETGVYYTLENGPFFLWGTFERDLMYDSQNNGLVFGYFAEEMAKIGTNVEIGKVKVTATGAHSSFSKVYSLVLDETCTTIPVTAVTLDNLNVRF